MYKGSDTTATLIPLSPFLSFSLPIAVANTATLGRALLRLLHAHEYVAGFSFGSNAISEPHRGDSRDRVTRSIDPSASA